MARTYSTMMPLGTQAPDFSLPNTINNETVALSSLKGDAATLIMFICNHCPFVKHLQRQLGELSEYLPKGLGVAAINSNDVENYPEDSPENMKIFAEENRFHFPYLYDESQSTARAYGAACTPDFFLFDNNLNCIYRGRFDGASPGNDTPVTGDELKAAIDNCLVGLPVSGEQKPSIGCNIKWKR